MTEDELELMSRLFGGQLYYRNGIQLPEKVTADELRRWAEAREQERVVDRTQVGPVTVSTVFLGIDHNFFGDGPPLLYETMLFTEDQSVADVDGEEGWFTDRCERYPTEDDAREGHRRWVRYVKENHVS